MLQEAANRRELARDRRRRELPAAAPRRSEIRDVLDEGANVHLVEVDAARCEPVAELADVEAVCAPRRIREGRRVEESCRCSPSVHADVFDLAPTQPLPARAVWVREPPGTS